MIQIKWRIEAALLALVLLLGSISGGLLFGAHAAENEAPKLDPNHPDRYVVKDGDTLWGIAQKFLVDPWRWPEIWQQNPDIENPHLIFPGDVLVMSTASDGESPQVRVLRERKLSKLSPTVRAESLDEAVPTIPPSVILPFLRKPLVIDRGELDNSPYVAVGEEGKIALGKYSVFFGRGFDQTEAGKLYHIFRPGKLLIHPETNESLASRPFIWGSPES